MWKTEDGGQVGLASGGRIWRDQFGNCSKIQARGNDYLTQEIHKETQKPYKALGKLGPGGPSIFDRELAF